MARPAQEAPAQKWDDGTTDYIPTRTKKRDDFNANKVHVAHQPWSWSNWHQKINWINVIFTVILPFGGLIASYWTPLNRYTAMFAVFYYFNTGLGITAGM